MGSEAGQVRKGRDGEVRSGGTRLSSEQLREGGLLAWATWGEPVSKISKHLVESKWLGLEPSTPGEKGPPREDPDRGRKLLCSALQGLTPN